MPKPSIPPRPGPGGRPLPETPDETGTEYIGSAHMLPDRTLQLRLSAVTPGVASGEALLVIKPDDRRHAAMVEHLGGIEPGGYKPVPSGLPG